MTLTPERMAELRADTTTVTERVSEPAKRWANRWRRFDGAETTDDHLGWTWPSRDIAETKALKMVEFLTSENIQTQWLGAFPVPE
jgi:hypothetical protein